MAAIDQLRALVVLLMFGALRGTRALASTPLRPLPGACIPAIEVGNNSCTCLQAAQCLLLCPMAGACTNYHTLHACLMSNSTPVTVSASAGEPRAQTCASQFTRPCLAGQWLRQTTAGPPNVRRLQCSASRQMVAEQDTTTALTALLVDRVPCLSARFLPKPISSPLSVLSPSKLVPASPDMMVHAVCESTHRLVLPVKLKELQSLDRPSSLCVGASAGQLCMAAA